MRISLRWLQELVEVTLSPEDLAELLTIAGFEVEAIEDRRTWANGVVVGKVLSSDPHPNADKLSVCQVDIGAESEPLNIVCGAANVRAGLFVPVAPVGTYLPNIDLKIRPAKLRGMASQGMICSLAELGLEKESEGIYAFAEADLTLGSDVRPLLGLDDVVLDVTSTANRADALSMVGIAREVAALTGATLHLPTVQATPVASKASRVVLKVSEPQACPAYIGTVIDNLRVEGSPSWLRQRLQVAGIRAINNIVDVTNYILLEWGQPLHAFDYDALCMVGDLHRQAGSSSVLSLGVRYARTEESLKTLDGQTRSLQAQALLITANDQPVALAGVMGGEDTEVHTGTQNILLEAAIFDPVATRRSARSLGVRTEASTRYERGVNPAELEVACCRALQLITGLSGGQVVEQQSTAIPDSRVMLSRSIELRLDRVNQILGPVYWDEDIGELQTAEIEQILTALGCQIEPSKTQEGIWTVTVAPYRYRDLEREIDLIEEVARLYGYDNFIDTLPDKSEFGCWPLEETLVRRVREACRACGLTELIHYSLVKPGAEGQILLANPLFAEYSALRTELLPGLIDAFRYNLEQANGPLSGFEIGRVFWRDENGLQEADAIAGILGGDPTQGRWVRGGREQSLTWYEAKGVLESFFQRLGLAVEYQPSCQDARLHPGRTASLWLQGQRLGTFGQLHPQLRQEMDLPDAVYVFELDLELILTTLEQAESGQTLFQPYSTYPASDRDLAFFAPVSLSVGEIQRVIARSGRKILESVELFDEYRGQNVPAGQRSLAFRLIYRADDRTLTEADIEPVHQKIRETLEEQFNVVLRS